MKNKILLSTIITSLFISASALANTADTFVPNGTIGVNSDLYGNAGKYKTAASNSTANFNYNFAKDWNLNLQWERAFNLYDYNSNSDNQVNNNTSNIQGGLNYNHGYLGNTKIKWTSSVNVKNEATLTSSKHQGTTNATYTWITTSFDFAEYLPGSQYAKATQFAVMPMYTYGWTRSGADGHMNSGALALLTNWQLPANFTFQLNAFVMKEWYNGSMKLTDTRKNDDAWYGAFYAHLNYSHDLYNFSENTKLGFNFIGGLDPYMISNRSASQWFPFQLGEQQYQWEDATVTTSEKYNHTYTAFALPQLQLTSNVTSDITVTAYVGAKYANQVWGQTQAQWKLQPVGGVGVSYSF
ncbi:FomA family porin-like outer membrane protein [Cetobacterium ceti]